MAKANITINGRATTRGKQLRRGPCILLRDASEAQHFAASIIAITYVGGRRLALVVINDAGTHHSPKSNGHAPDESRIPSIEEILENPHLPVEVVAQFNSRAPEHELTLPRVHIHALGCEGCGRVDLPTTLFDGLLLCSECRRVVGGPTNGTPAR